MTKYSMIITFLFFTLCGNAIASEKAIVGVWVNQAGGGLIEITMEQGNVYGTIIGSPDSKTEERKDSKNPDPKLRNRSLLGAVILSDFTYHENKKWPWAGGWIYDPNNGKKYKCKIRLVDNETLEIRGYIGISLFGRTETWKRYRKTEP